MAPRVLFSCSDPQPPDIHLLDDFPGAVGNYDWTSFAYKVVPTRRTKENPQASPSLQVGEEWTKRVGLLFPNTVEDHRKFPFTAFFNDAALPEGYWCSGLMTILESELQAIDVRDRFVRVKAHQVIFGATFTNQVVPRIRSRVKLSSIYSRIGVIATVESPSHEILNIPRDFKLPDAHIGHCGRFGIYATSIDEKKRLQKMK